MPRQILANPSYLGKLPASHRSFHSKSLKKRRTAKLNWERVADIRESSDSDEVLAEKYGVHKDTIGNVRRFATWVR